MTSVLCHSETMNFRTNICMHVARQTIWINAFRHRFEIRRRIWAAHLSYQKYQRDQKPRWPQPRPILRPCISEHVCTCMLHACCMTRNMYMCLQISISDMKTDLSSSFMIRRSSENASYARACIITNENAHFMYTNWNQQKRSMQQSPLTIADD